MSSCMNDLTPIKIRGKRSASAAEKWHAGKKRRFVRPAATVSLKGKEALVELPSRNGGVPQARRRKPHERELSRLEELPTEILQDIFELSENFDLPSTSPGLFSQLNSQHIRLRLTSQLLHSVLRCPWVGDDPPSPAIPIATRLLESKFLTWPFFQGWLEEQRAERLPHVPQPDSSESYQVIWSLLQPDPRLPPPQKLLHGPWTDDQISFLSVFAAQVGDIGNLSPIHAELATEGLSQAIAEGSSRAVRLFLDMNVKPSTEMLRQAVCDLGCNQKIVEQLIKRATGRGIDVDFLDPALWSWSEKARRSEDEAWNNKGDWLLTKLRRASAVGRTDIDDLTNQVGRAHEGSSETISST